MDTLTLSSLMNLSHDQRSCLQRGHLSTVSDVLLLSVTDLAKKCRIVTSEAQSILDTICSELEPQLHPLSLEDPELRQDECFTTGDVVLDRALGGGLRTGKVWEIVGESAAGKTQLCLQLALSVQLARESGGANGAACLLSTSWTPPTNRLLEIVNNHRNLSASECTLSNIQTVKTPTIPSLLHVLSNLFPQLVGELATDASAKPVKLLVLDALTELFHSDPKFSSETLFDRSKDLSHISTLLHQLAQRFNIAVVVVNEVVDVIERAPPEGALPHEIIYQDQARLFNRATSLPGEDRREAALGLVWANQVNARIMLSRTKRRRFLAQDEMPAKRSRGDALEPSAAHDDQEPTLIRRLSVIFNSVGPSVSLDYVVTSGGIAVLSEKPLTTHDTRTSITLSSEAPLASEPQSVELSDSRAVDDIALLDIPLAEVIASQELLPSDDDPVPPSDGPQGSASQPIPNVEDGPLTEEDEWDTYWRETDLGSDVYTQALDALSTQTAAHHGAANS